MGAGAVSEGGVRGTGGESGEASDKVCARAPLRAGRAGELTGSGGGQATSTSTSSTATTTRCLPTAYLLTGVGLVGWCVTAGEGWREGGRWRCRR
eukprot:1266363-Rhodomonas_salina.1